MRILLVRTSALGDIVHCLPVLTALRTALPEVRIAWAVEEMWAPVLAGHPDIDRLILVRSKAWRKIPRLVALRDILRCRRELRSFGADVALDLMGNHKGAVLARWSRARRVIGARRADRREPSSALWLKETVATSSDSEEVTHAVDQALAVMQGLDLEQSLGVEMPSEVDFGGDKLLQAPPVSALPLLDELDSVRAAGRPVVAIQAGAGWANKTWPAVWFGEVARGLRAEADADVRVLLAPGEEELARRVVDAAAGAARTIDTVDFRVLAAVLRRSDLLLGGDTGPLHLAHALGTPVLCLVGPTDPRRNGPYGDPEGVVFQRLPCSYCYKRFDEPKACLLQLTPERVLLRALDRYRNRMRSRAGRIRARLSLSRTNCERLDVRTADRGAS